MTVQLMLRKLLTPADDYTLQTWKVIKNTARICIRVIQQYTHLQHRNIFTQQAHHALGRNDNVK